MAVIEPPVCCALLVLVQLWRCCRAPHETAQSTNASALLGSILKTVMNGNTSPAIPVMTEAELAPPFVDRRNERPVVSKNIVLVLAGFTATYPPSPPLMRAHAFGPVTSVPRWCRCLVCRRSRFVRSDTAGRDRTASLHSRYSPCPKQWLGTERRARRECNTADRAAGVMVPPPTVAPFE